MPQQIGCPNPNCTMRLQVPDDAVGKQVRCPRCQHVFAVPTPKPAVAKVPVPAGGGGAAPAPGPVVAPPPPPVQSPVAGSTAAASNSATAATTPKDQTNRCPTCNAELYPGAISCIECGYLLHSDTSGPSDVDGPPNLCPNPACGVANPPGEAYCQRCSTALPMAPGTLLHNRYRIERLIAMGGFGAVYLATDTKNGNQPVAVKNMICADQQEFSIRLNFFRREAEILRSLINIPIVPRVHDLIEQGQSAYLVMEFIRGQDMLKLMEANNNAPFSMEQVIEWGKQICDVLTHMHTQQPPLIHRDLKPDNIMLLEDKRSIKMIDFGTARDLGRTVKEKLAQKTRVYTEGYAPPEQIVGKPEPRSDLFALAGTLYHLATGKPPSGHLTAKDIEEQLADTSSPVPASQRWFFDLIRINLSEDLNERYFSAREIRADLEKRAVTQEIPCPRCRAGNKVREPYCCKCAEALTDPTAPCHHCGKTNRMGSRCCIYCGNRLR